MNTLYTAALSYASSLLSDDRALMAQYSAHLTKYGISYATEEEHAFRFQQFALNDQKIQAINSRNGTFKATHNKFSTLTPHEMKKVLGKKPASIAQTATKLPTDNIANEIDWRQKGALQPVQDQGFCGSCWSFSSVAAMEAAHFIKTGELLKLSEQQFVDCDPQSEGCNGGLEVYAFQYAEQNPLELEKDYPYKGKDGVRCSASKKKEVVGVSDYAHVPENSADQLRAAIDQQPVCISVEADTYIMFYDSGIIDVDDCGTDLDHAVTAVGYGTEDGQDYFIVRNSWGADWGEDGYFRIAATNESAGGVCGIFMDSNYPHTN